MSKRTVDPTFSPLLLLVPLPFVLATCFPLNLDHPRAAAPKAQRMAAAQAEDRAPVEPAASVPQPGAATDPRLGPR